MKLANKDLFRQQSFIDGQWIVADNKKTFEVNNPFDGEVLARVAHCGKNETERAVSAAAHAWPAWRSLTSDERADFLLKWAHLVDENKEDLSRIMTCESGKAMIESRAEMTYANNFIIWFAEEARRIYGDIISTPIPGDHILTSVLDKKIHNYVK